MNEPTSQCDSLVVDTLNLSTQSVSLPTQPAIPEPVPLENELALNEYSRSFLHQLMRAHPEWRPLARATVTGEEDGEWLYLEVVAPSTKMGKAWISTEDGQVTVGVGLYHTHFVTYPPATDGQMFAAAINLIDDLINERLVVLSSRGASWLRPHDNALKRPKWSMPIDSSIGPIALLSWTGRFDRVLDWADIQNEPEGDGPACGA